MNDLDKAIKYGSLLDVEPVELLSNIAYDSNSYYRIIDYDTAILSDYDVSSDPRIKKLIDVSLAKIATKDNPSKFNSLVNYPSQGTLNTLSTLLPGDVLVNAFQGARGSSTFTNAAKTTAVGLAAAGLTKYAIDKYSNAQAMDVLLKLNVSCDQKTLDTLNDVYDTFLRTSLTRSNEYDIKIRQIFNNIYRCPNVPTSIVAQMLVVTQLLWNLGQSGSCDPIIYDINLMNSLLEKQTVFGPDQIYTVNVTQAMVTNTINEFKKQANRLATSKSITEDLVKSYPAAVVQVKLVEKYIEPSYLDSFKSAIANIIKNVLDKFPTPSNIRSNHSIKAYMNSLSNPNRQNSNSFVFNGDINQAIYYEQVNMANYVPDAQPIVNKILKENTSNDLLNNVNLTRTNLTKVKTKAPQVFNVNESDFVNQLRATKLTIADNAIQSLKETLEEDQEFQDALEDIDIPITPEEKETIVTRIAMYNNSSNKKQIRESIRLLSPQDKKTILKAGVTVNPNTLNDINDLLDNDQLTISNKNQILYYLKKIKKSQHVKPNDITKIDALLTKLNNHHVLKMDDSCIDEDAILTRENNTEQYVLTNSFGTLQALDKELTRLQYRLYGKGDKYLDALNSINVARSKPWHSCDLSRHLLASIDSRIKDIVQTAPSTITRTIRNSSLLSAVTSGLLAYGAGYSAYLLNGYLTNYNTQVDAVSLERLVKASINRDTPDNLEYLINNTNLPIDLVLLELIEADRGYSYISKLRQWYDIKTNTFLNRYIGSGFTERQFQQSIIRAFGIAVDRRSKMSAVALLSQVDSLVTFFNLVGIAYKVNANDVLEAIFQCPKIANYYSLLVASDPNSTEYVIKFIRNILELPVNVKGKEVISRVYGDLPSEYKRALLMSIANTPYNLTGSVNATTLRNNALMLGVSGRDNDDVFHSLKPGNAMSNDLLRDRRS